MPPEAHFLIHKTSENVWVCVLVFWEVDICTVETIFHSCGFLRMFPVPSPDIRIELVFGTCTLISAIPCELSMDMELCSDVNSQGLKVIGLQTA